MKKVKRNKMLQKAVDKNIMERFRKEAEPQISNMIAEFLQWQVDDMEHEEIMELASEIQEHFFSKIYSKGE